MVCPICVTTVIAANAHVIATASLAVGGAVAVKMKHAPRKPDAAKTCKPACKPLSAEKPSVDSQT